MSKEYLLLPGSPSVDCEGQPYRRRPARKGLLLMSILLAVVVFGFVLPNRLKVDHNNKGVRTVELTYATGKHIPDASVAYATLLTGSVADKDGPAERDNYFTAARMLCYQILHDPKTKTALDAPCLVLTTPNVRQDKIDQLREDGATVVPVSYITSSWATTDIGTWQDVLSKIHLWRMTEYDLITFLDTDRVLIESLDGIFTDPAVVVADNLKIKEYIKDDEKPQPEDYLFASTAEMTKNHSFPPKTEPEDFFNIHYFEAGTFVMRPSKKMYDHHLSVLAIPDRFDPHLPEQNMWNYIYRHNGNMPWVQLDTSWSAHFPTLKDIELGAKSIHDKFWLPAHPEMEPLLLETKQNMLDFYRNRAEEKAKSKIRKLYSKIHDKNAKRSF